MEQTHVGLKIVNAMPQEDEYPSFQNQFEKIATQLFFILYK